MAGLIPNVDMESRMDRDRPRLSGPQLLTWGQQGRSFYPRTGSTITGACYGNGAPYSSSNPVTALRIHVSKCSMFCKQYDACLILGTEDIIDLVDTGLNWQDATR